MTRRERLERRAERREQWAEGRKTKAAAAWAGSDLREERSGIPLGQPILVGHHSERHHRRAIDRAAASATRALDHDRKATEHAAAAATIRDRLDSSIYSDDADAIEALERRAAEHDAEAERANAANKAWRRGGRDALAEVIGAAKADRFAADHARSPAVFRLPCSTTSPRAAARRDRERIEQIKRGAAARARVAEATAAADGPVLFDAGNGYARIAFPEVPPRVIRDALKAAGWGFRDGAWCGRLDTLPPSAAALVCAKVGPEPEPAAAPEAEPEAEAEPEPELARAVALDRREKLAAALRGRPERNPIVELIEDGSETWRGSLADWLSAQDPSAWAIEDWRRVFSLSGNATRITFGGGAAPIVELRKAER